MKTNPYLNTIEEQTKKEFVLAAEARKKGNDMSDSPEIYMAKDVAEKVEGLVELHGISKEIRKFADQHDSELEVAFDIIKHVIKSEPNKEKAADKAIRAGLAYITQGAVAAPLEGIAKVRIKKNPDGSDYLSVYYAGPIRAAGGTAEALSVIISDYARSQLGLDRYKPTSQETGRYYEEIQWYHRRSRLQYYPPEAEVTAIVRNTPVCIDGEPTEKYEVANYRDLGRVETNRVRGGMCLVLAEGMAQKAPKILKRIKPIEKKYGLNWSWLEELLAKKTQKEEPDEEKKEDLAESLKTDDEDWNWIEDHDDNGEPEVGGSEKYIKEIPAGRPVFAYPSRKGGFRLRYGRTRASGYAAVGMHPATMHVLNDFIALGTQIRLELPGKAAIVTPCDSAEGPLVLLDTGEVLRINSIEQSLALKKNIKKILQLGDILISLGEFIENNHQLLPGAWCEEYWALAAKEKMKTTKRYGPFLKPPYKTPDFKTAKHISNDCGIPIHPAHTFYWHDITLNQLRAIIQAISKSDVKKNRIILDYTEEVKEALEYLGVFHKNENKKIIITKHAEALLAALGFGDKLLKTFESEAKKTKSVMAIVNNLAPFKIKKRAPTRIGARMGRPEKAKPRKMNPPVNVMFPTGGVKGRVRDIMKIASSSGVESPEIAKFKCSKCNSIGISPKCSNCGSKTSLVRVCPRCQRNLSAGICPICKTPTNSYEKREINIKEIVQRALKKLDEKPPKKMKGVLGMSSRDKIPEPIEKGILRAKYDLPVFKDGTIRFDSTNAPLTHFKPAEIKAPIKKLKELGYTEDINGKRLESENQILELKPQDIVLSDHKEDSASDFFLRAAAFVDDLLTKHYGLEPYYKAKKKEDLIGTMIIGLAPHTSTGIVGRIIGFTNARVCYANPCFHAATRRDCVHPKTQIVIWDEDNQQLHSKEIGSLVDELIKKHPKNNKKQPDGFSLFENKFNWSSLSIDPSTNKIVKRKITKFLKGPQPTHWLKITTTTNRTFTMTPTHDFLYFDDNKFRSKKASKIKINDKIPIVTNLPIEETLIEPSLVEVLEAIRDKFATSNKKDYVLDTIKSIEALPAHEPCYCLDIETESKELITKNVLWGDQIVQIRCDGDENACLLLLDAFLNFSRAFLPKTRGGKMDAPLVITTILDPLEVDDEVYDFDLEPGYPLAFYRAADKGEEPNAIKVRTVGDLLHDDDPFLEWGFTHETSDINLGPVVNIYTLGEMLDKLDKQLELAKKIAAVDDADVASRILNTHFIPDMKGNLRTFARQKVRCTKCNAKYRRPPLKGVCTRCGNNLTLTVHEGTIKKYLEVSREMVKKYNVSIYLKQQIELLDRSIDSIFGKETQTKLGAF